jgi:periplasmic protein TonB
MRAFLLRLRTAGLRHRGQLLSVVVHAVLLAFLFSGVRWSPRVAPYRLPGTKLGNTVLTYYAPGSVKPVASKSPVKSPEKVKQASTLHPTPAPVQPIHAEATETHAGTGTAVESGLGEGEITIALQSYFPYPKPDLSGLPHGTKGDVILNAVIDENGKIKELTLLKGLGSPIDQQVIATVESWTYTPAKKNGVPVPSEQELHFHYERG